MTTAPCGHGAVQTPAPALHERTGWLSSRKTRIAGISTAALAAVVGLLYLQWRPEHGSEQKTDAVLHASREQPVPLTIPEVRGANLLKILQQRELSLGVHAIALKIDKQHCVRLVVRDKQGCRHEFHLADSGTLSKAVNETVCKPDGCGFGFVIVEEDGEDVLRASAAGFIARVKTTDIDNGLGMVLEDQRNQRQQALHSRSTATEPGVSKLSLPFRSKTPFSLESMSGTEDIALQPVAPEPALDLAKHP